MAYLAFHDIGTAGGAGAAAASALRTAADNRLTALEWSVVALARRDRISTLRAPGAWSKATRWLLRQRNPRLADDRLEALRRMAVLSWRDGYMVPSHEVRDFLAAGFTPGQYETMVNYTADARRLPPRTVGAA